MSETKQLPARESIPVEKTWDLTKIYADDAAFDIEFQEIQAQVKEAVTKAL